MAPAIRIGGTPSGAARPVTIAPAKPIVRDEGPVKPRDVDYKDIPKKMKFDYEHALKDQIGRSIPAVQALLQQLEAHQPDVHRLMQEASNLISRQFGIMNIAIGLRGADGLYRYDTLVGFREDAITERRRIAYKKEEFYDAGPYKGYWISKYTKVYLSEDHPYADFETPAYNRPILLKNSRRKSLAESLEGDYIDVCMMDENNEPLGWIEVSGTRTGQFPDAMAIRWIEIIGTIIGVAVRMQKGR